MDVSIAVSLIRGQMGAVVERAVNGAVEMVLAEMLKVVGVKFEELKSQVAVMKRDMAMLQREKALKEKDNDNIRSKLRYTELKLKYYRQGVEEELQQRASVSTLVHHDPSTFHQSERAAENSSSCATQTRISDGKLTRTSPVTHFLTEHNTVQNKEDDCEWTITLQPHTEAVDAVKAPPLVQGATLDVERQPVVASLSPDDSPQADSSTLPSSAPRVKQEEEEEEEEEVICIKEEPEDEQEVMATLLLDCQMEQNRLLQSEGESSVAEWSVPPAAQRNPMTTFCSAGQNHYAMPQPASSMLPMVTIPPSVQPRQAARPWTKDLSLYEEYKLRRNELRRRRRREMEKTLPQPLLADMVRERREKTRLRVARWRAKRKLQACMNQAQPVGGAAGHPQTGFPSSTQHQQPSMPCAASSSNQQRQISAPPPTDSFLNSLAAGLPFMPSSSSSSLLLRDLSMVTRQHTVTSSSSTSIHPQVNLSQQSFCLTDADILQ